MSNPPASGPRQAEFIIRPNKLAKLPAVGSYMRSPSGKSVYRVIGAKLLRVGGSKKDEPRFRLVCVRARDADVPPGTVIAPWPAAPPRAAWKPAAAVFERSVPSVAAIRRSKLDAARAARDRVLSGAGDEDRIIPAALGTTIVGPGGGVLRGALIQDGEWWDPEDTNRTTRHKKVVRGKRRVDPVERLSAHNSSVTREHILAADLYRQAYERQACALRGWHLENFGGGGGFGPSAGPSDERLAASMQWGNVQEFVKRRAGATGIRALNHVVLERNSVLSWAEGEGLNKRGQAAKRFVEVLDGLVEYFEADIEKHSRKLEDVA